MTLGQFIKNKRLEKNMTMEQLGTAIGKNKVFIHRLEKNKVKTLKDDTIVPLANALGIPVMALFDGWDIEGKKVEVEQITPKEFQNEVKDLLNKTDNLNDQEKALLLQTLNLICSEKE